LERPRLEVADIFRRHGPAWRRANSGHVSLGQLKVMSAIENCRTAALGGHVARCENEKCGHTQIAYNSCLMGKFSNGELTDNRTVCRRNRCRAVASSPLRNLPIRQPRGFISSIFTMLPETLERADAARALISATSTIRRSFIANQPI
jgi:Transposase zinc-binding domain